MKRHEKKAIERAVDFLLSQQERQPVSPKRAVEIAQLRAHRLYNYQTQLEALRYAEKLLEERRCL